MKTFESLQTGPTDVLRPEGWGGRLGAYLDLIDAVGTSTFFGHYNGLNKETLGWLPSDLVVVEATESGCYFLTPFETRTLGPKVLKVSRQDDSWYVEYRTPTGFDAVDLEGFTGGAGARQSSTGLPGDWEE